MKSLAANWKTTAFGLGTIVVPVINQMIPLMDPQWAAVAGGVVAGLGLIFAKDGNVTGGTTKQPSS